MTIVQKEKKQKKKTDKPHGKFVKFLKRKQKLKEKKKDEKKLSKPKEESKPAKVNNSPLSAEESALKLTGIPFTATKSEVKKWFQDDGMRVEEVYMCGEARKTGMAYVTMKSDVSLKKGLKKDMQYMGERYIKVVLKRKKEMQEVLRLSAMLDNSVFLRGLPYEIYTLDILRFFEGLKIAENGIHIKNRGFAIVEFVDSETATEALKRNNKYIRERYVKVFRSRMKDLVEMRDQILEAKSRKRNITKQEKKKEKASSESMETEESEPAENTESVSSKEESVKEEEEKDEEEDGEEEELAAEVAMEVESPKESDSEEEDKKQAEEAESESEEEGKKQTEEAESESEEEEDKKQTEEAESESKEDEVKNNGEQEESENGIDEQKSESDAEEELEEEVKGKKPKGKKKTVVDVVMDKFSPRRLRSRSGTPSKAQTPQVKRLQTPRTPKAAGTPKTPRATGTPITPKTRGTPRTPRASTRRGKKE